MEQLIKGLYYEFVALPCNDAPYSMPLGLLMREEPLFRVYRGTGLYRLLGRGRRPLYLLSPFDPMAFVYSVDHSLERRIEWEGKCPKVDPSIGAWFHCVAEFMEASDNADLYICRGFKALTRSLHAYSRTYGCLVELLVLKTKVDAGVLGEDSLDYARWLYWCVRRSSPGDERYAGVALSVLQEIERAVRSS